MTAPQHNTDALPRFERPSEAVVYRTLTDLCGGAGGLFQVSLRQLARHCQLAVSTTNRAVLALSGRGLIQYRRGANQARLSTFRMPAGGDTETAGRAKPSAGTTELSGPATAGPKNGAPSAIVTRSDTSPGYSCNSDIGGLFPENEDSTCGNPAERLARRIATELDDLKNLPLYISYCYRFPVGVILNAFARAKETPQAELKKSRGALFNFLVQLYGGKHKNNPRPGHQAR